MKNKIFKKKFIYLISPNKIKNNRFYKQLEYLFKAKKINFFQLRLKRERKKNILIIGKKIRKICKKYKVKFIINDDPFLAKKLDSDGCHLGQKDMKIFKAKKILKNKIIGITCHGSKKLIINAKKNKPNYIALGSFFKSRLKPNTKKAKKSLIKWCKQKTNLPIVAIGGIDNKNYKSLIKLGVNYLAISSFIWNNPRFNPKDAIKKFELK